MRVYTYYAPIGGRNEEWLIQQWKETWSANGWEPVVLSDRDVRIDPRDNETLKAFPTVNTQSYEMACWHRWWAMSGNGGLMTDYDVLNFGFGPENAELGENIKILAGSVPCAVYGSPTGFRNICKLFVTTIPSQHTWSDMYACEALSPYFSHSNDCVQFRDSGWQDAKLVHFSHSSFLAGENRENMIPCARLAKSVRANTDTVQVIMAHGKASETFHRNAPIWRSLPYDRIVFSPWNDPLEIHDACNYSWGTACHAGEHAIDRFKRLLWFLSATPYENFLIQEYDSFSLAQLTALEDGLYGNLFHETDPRWMARHFTHPPLAMNRKTLHRIAHEAPRIHSSFEKGFWDRWICYLCEGFGIPIHGWNELGFAQNTIQDNQLDHAREKKRNGAVHFHGVKTQSAFNTLTR